MFLFILSRLEAESAGCMTGRRSPHSSRPDVDRKLHSDVRLYRKQLNAVHEKCPTMSGACQMLQWAKCGGGWVWLRYVMHYIISDDPDFTHYNFKEERDRHCHNAFSDHIDQHSPKYVPYLTSSGMIFSNTMPNTLWSWSELKLIVLPFLQ